MKTTPLKKSRSLLTWLLLLLAPMIASLMGLGAGVRAMNAGLACPDWPLCFGKIIPHFHIGTYFEFIHRVFAGILSLFFLFCCVLLFRDKTVGSAPKWLMRFGLLLLLGQIVMGALTVLKQLKVIVVSSHLMLGTLWFSTVLLTLFFIEPNLRSEKKLPAKSVLWMLCLPPFIVLGQILLGGLVAASYAGSVCVDFPLCNGRFIPTLSGGIGLQILHRLGAYVVVLYCGSVAVIARMRAGAWQLSPQILHLAEFLALCAFAQMCLGIANLILYIPPLMTVLHQSMAIVTLAVSWRLAFVAWHSQ